MAGLCVSQEERTGEVKTLIFQHSASEGAGAFLFHMQFFGDFCDVVHLYKGDPLPPLDPYDLLLVLGGPMDVWQTNEHPWLAEEKKAIRQWVEQLERPYLGICLGHQLLVDALGGRCASMDRPEIAITTVTQTKSAAADPVFSALPKSLPCIQWHGVEAVTLPDDSTVLASNNACDIQAIRVGPHAWGLQFHPELQSGMVRSWMRDEDNLGAAVQWLGSEHKARALEKESDRVSDELQKISLTIWSRFRSLRHPQSF